MGGSLGWAASGSCCHVLVESEKWAEEDGAWFYQEQKESQRKTAREQKGSVKGAAGSCLGQCHCCIVRAVLVIEIKETFVILVSKISK